MGNEEKTWFVGSSGDYYRDMGGARYCVMHETVGYHQDGRRIFKYSANRNGNQISAELHATADEAKAACERVAKAA